MKRIFAFLFLVLVAALGLGFAVLNAGEVELNYYFGRTMLPLALIVIGALVGGALLGVAASLGMVLIQKGENSRLRRRITVLEKEIRNVREMPIRDRH